MKSILLVFFFLPYLTLAQSEWTWALSADIGEPKNEIMYSSSVGLSTDEILVAGTHNSQILRLGNKQMSGLGGTDIFLALVDDSGNIKRLINYGGTRDEWVADLAVDSKGNIVLAGYFNSDSLIIDGTKVYNPSGGHELMLAKFNPNLELQWIRTAGSINSAGAQEVTILPNDDIVVAGYFDSNELNFFGKKVINASEENTFDIWVARFSAEGQFIWVNSLNGYFDERVRGITSDNDGNVYLAGDFDSPELKSGANSYVNKGSRDFFLAKMNGQTGAVVQLNGYGTSGSDQLRDIIFDPNGQIYVTGFFNGVGLSFDNIRISNAQGGHDFILAKLNTNFLPVWVKSTGNTNSAFGIHLQLDTKGNVYLAGWYDALVLNVFGKSITNNSSSNKHDLWVSKWNSAGDILWLQGAGGPEIDIIGGFTLLEEDKFLLTGNTTSQVIKFGGIFVTGVLNGYGQYIAMFNQRTTNTVSHTSPKRNVFVYPNPTAGIITVVPDEQFEENVKYNIIDLNGRIVKSGFLNDVSKTIDLTSLAGGHYKLRILIGNTYQVYPIQVTVG